MLAIAVVGLSDVVWLWSGRWWSTKAGGLVRGKSSGRKGVSWGRVVCWDRLRHARPGLGMVRRQGGARERLLLLWLVRGVGEGVGGVGGGRGVAGFGRPRHSLGMAVLDKFIHLLCLDFTQPV